MVLFPSIKMTDTIVAIATGQGGALAIVRTSGPKAVSATASIFRFSLQTEQAHRLSDCPAGTFHHGWIAFGDEIVDEVIVSLYRAPHSYTGEDATEITCHGSPYILQRIIESLLHEGCRVAEPGEFTKLAFLNHRMDLSQAEAVADLIASTTEAAHRMALNQMRGLYSSRLRELRRRLLDLTTLVELELDFSDQEDARFADRQELLLRIEAVEDHLRQLAGSFATGNAIKHGIPVVIVGAVNVGKSMLLNRLTGDERAIVSSTEGTTRDAIEDTITINGVGFRLIDTAGLRPTTDEVEQMGIAVTYRKLHQATIVVRLCESSRPTPPSDELLRLCEGKTLICALNKSDLLPAVPSEPSDALKKSMRCEDVVYISAKTGYGIDRLTRLISAAVPLSDLASGDIVISNSRHYDAIIKALDAARRAHQGLNMELPTDLLAQDLRECIAHLSEIIGDITTDETLSSIFSHFCIGK